MKKTIVTTFILLIGNFVYSQNVYAEYLESKKMSENSKRVMPKGLFAMRSKSYLYVLEYSKGESLYKNHPKSLNIKTYDTIYEENGIEIKETLFDNTIEKMLYKNYANNELLYTNPTGKDDVLYVKDKMLDWNWKIEQETRTINNFLCKKATSFIKGIPFTVWFTEDIPIDCGPAFLNGLPGLIVYAENENAMWELKKINTTADVKIEKPNFENQKTFTIDEIQKELTRRAENVSIEEPLIIEDENIKIIQKTIKVIKN
jgi:GLPGLI family protein